MKQWSVRTELRMEEVFTAESARLEEEAARDLALSLLQGRSLRDAILQMHDPWILLSGGRAEPVLAAAEDHLVAGRDGSFLIPSPNALVRSGHDPRRAERDSGTFVAKLRGAVRGSSACSVEAGAAQVTGRLLAGGPDWLLLDSGSRQWVVSLKEVRVVQLLSREPRG